MANTPVIEKFLQAIETAAIPGCDAWSADATLDATVPGWRLHAAGSDAIRAEYAWWFADPGHFDELRRYAVQDGTAGGGPTEVVEYTLSWTENGVPHGGAEIGRLTLQPDGAGRTTSSRWPAPTCARHRTSSTTWPGRCTS